MSKLKNHSENVKLNLICYVNFKLSKINVNNLKFGLIGFLRVTAATSVARLSHHYSVCLSICLSRGWSSQELCKLGSPNLHRQLPGRLQFQEP